MARQSFIAEGWNALHLVALDAGAEVDYYPPYHSGVAARDYLDTDRYAVLVAPLVQLSGIDTLKLGYRSSTIKASIWRWIRKTAARDAPSEWKFLSGLRTRTSLMGEFSGYLAGKHLASAPKYTPANPASVVRYGYWLIREQGLLNDKPILPIIWGLSLIGATWRDYLRSGCCKFCCRRSKPGTAFCHFHSQGGVTEQDRSKAYIRYRHGRLARDLAIERGLGEKLWSSPMARQMTERLTLPDVLFQMKPKGPYDDEHLLLAMTLKVSPRVIDELGGPSCLNLPYDDLLNLLVERIDPYEWEWSEWPRKIHQMEIWLALEDEASPGSRGRGLKTNTLVQQAVRLADLGIRNCSIAVQLGVAPSTVSRWLQRYPELRMARNQPKD